MTFRWARAQYPWVDLQDVRFEHYCKKCGSGFVDGWYCRDGDKWVEICEDCIYSWAQEKGSLARHYIEEKSKWGEYLEWWFKGEHPAERERLLRKIYEEYEQDKAECEAEWASQERDWTEFVIDESEGERL